MANDPVLDSAAWDRLALHARAAATAIEQTPAVASPESERPPGGLTRLARAVLARHRAAWHTLLHPFETFRAWLARLLAPPADARSTTAVRGAAGASKIATTDGQTPTVTPEHNAQAPTPSLEATWQSVRDALLEAAQDPTADPKGVGTRIAATIPAEHRTQITERLTALAQTAEATAQALQAKAQPPESSPARAEPSPAKTATKGSAPAEPQRRGPQAPLAESPPMPVASASVPSRSTKRAVHR